MATITSVYTEVFDAVVSLAEGMTPAPYADILSGPMPVRNGLAMYVSTGDNLAVSLSRGSAVNMTVVLNGKHEDQTTVLDGLNAVHAYLSRLKSYPRTETWQITDIQPYSLPSYLDREDDGQWLYGSSLTVRFYYF